MESMYGDPIMFKVSKKFSDGLEDFSAYDVLDVFMIQLWWACSLANILPLSPAKWVNCYYFCLMLCVL